MGYKYEYVSTHEQIIWKISGHIEICVKLYIKHWCIQEAHMIKDGNLKNIHLY